MAAAYSRLGRVERVGAVTDVLGAVKHPVGQTGQEVSGGQVARHRPDREPGPLWDTGKKKEAFY